MSAPVKVPADLEHPDKVLAGLTARQVLILSGTALVIYGGWLAAQLVMPLLVYLLLAAPLAVGGAGLALFTRNGISMDRHAAAALAYRLTPRLRTGPPPPDGEPVPGWLLDRAEPVELTGDLTHLPAGRTAPLSLPLTHIGPAHTTHGTHQTGGRVPAVLDLGGHGCALIAAATPVPFTLRDEAEQAAIVACFARLLHAADAPLQILVRAQPLDLAPAINEIAHAAATLPHPALRAAAAEHHAYLTDLAAQELLTRQILLVLRDPTPTGTSAHAAGVHARLISRLGDATRAVAPAGIGLTPLEPAAAEAVLAAAFDPDRPLTTTSHPRSEYGTHPDPGYPHAAATDRHRAGAGGWSS